MPIRVCCKWMYPTFDSNLHVCILYKTFFPQTAGIFDNRLVVDQLRACGIVETIKIRQTGYPVRHLFIDFVKR